MRRILFGANVVALAALLLVWPAAPVQAKPDYTKKEGKPCTTCHVKMGVKELNDSGKCYEKAKSLKDCVKDEKKKG